MSTASAPLPAHLPAHFTSGQRRVVTRTWGAVEPETDRVRPMPGPATTRRRTGRAPRPAVVRSCALDVDERRFLGERLTRRGRLVVAGTFVLLLVLVIGGLTLATRAIVASGAAEPTQTRHVLVQPGQTTWEIAESAAPGADVRATVDQIVELNGLESAGDLTAGERLRVPMPTAER